MSQTGPWSVKGIDQRAREAAREAASSEGLTLGEYLNRLLIASEDSPQPNEVSAPYQAPRPQPDAASSTLDRLTRRIEATEARSTLAITGMDQSVLGLLARLENAEQNSSAIGGHVESLIDELRSTHDSLQAKVQNLEADDSAKQNLEALKSLENALGKLASHVYEENELNHNEAEAVKGRVEAGFMDITNRVDGMETKVEKTLSDAASRVERAVEQAELRAEGTARHLSERMSSLESNMHERLSTVGNADERLSAVETDVSGALESMESTLLRIQDRLNRAETTTDTALKHLESTFGNLDQRIEAVASSVDPELADRLRAEFEARFEDLTNHVRETVSSTRLELADEIAKAATGEDMAIVLELKENLDQVTASLAAVEERQVEGIETISKQVTESITASEERQAEGIETISEKVAESIAASEERQAEGMEAISQQVTTCIAESEDRQTQGIEAVSEKISTMSANFDERITRSEERSADAIEQIGHQVATVTGRMQKRQDDVMSSLTDKMDENRKRANARLSDALANVSERLELMQTQSASSMSPVQKAIASLATRLEAVEDFAAPPFAKAPAAPELPAVDALPVNPPLFTQEEIEPEPTELDIAASDDGVQFEAGIAFDEEIEPDTDVDLTEDFAANFSEDFTEDFSEDFAIDLTDDLEAAEPPAPIEIDPELPAVAAEADPFEAGLDSWEVISEVEMESPYKSDFDAIKAAADAISVNTTELHDYVADVPGEPDGENFLDPVAELEGFDDDHSEARDSDVFDMDDAAAAFDAPDFDAQDDAPEKISEEVEAETEDYIARARRAAIAANASDTVSGRKRSSTKARKKGGVSKAPLMLAASAVVIAGATASVMLLRGKQAPPAAEAAKSVYVDPGKTAAGATAAAAIATTDISDTSGIEDASLAAAAADADTTPMVTEDDLFDPAPDAAVTTTATAEPIDTASIAAPGTASFAPIPPVVSVEASANAGDHIAQFQFAQDRIAAGDFQAGANFMRKSAQKGAPMAQYHLAKLHEKGTGVPKDLALAREWTEKSALGGNTKAMHDLAVFMAEGDGGPQSYAGAVEWFRKGAEYGVVDSQYNLGILYAQGLGISPNLTEALFWFEVAARNGDPGAPAKVTELKSRVSTVAAAQAKTRAEGWTASYGNAIANGRFGVQPWNTGNPLQVKGVQTALNALGFAAGSPDGVMGDGTANAIRKYQTANSLEATGTITPDLIDSLNKKADTARG